MDNRKEVREFLSSRRARVSPGDAGLSIDYYIRLERGNLGGASESVLGELAPQ